MATPVVESSTLSNQDGDSTTFTVDMPSTRPDGDLYIAIIAKDGTGNVTDDSGNWTELHDTAGAAQCLAIYYKVGSSEPASYDFSGASEEWAGIVYRISGQGSTPIDADGGASATNSGSSGNADGAAVTPSGVDPLIIVAAALDTDTFSAGPSSWDNFQEEQSGSKSSGRASVAAATLDGTISVESDPGAFTNTSDSWNTYTFVVLPPQVPTVTSIDGGSETVDTRQNVTIVGNLFGASDTGSAAVYISDNSTLGVGTDIEIPRDSWSATSIQVDMEETGTGNPLDDDFSIPGTLYVIVVDSSATEGTGFAFTLKPPGATWLENLNTNTSIDVSAGNAQARLRMQMDNDGGPATTPAFKWRYSKNSGAYADITTSSDNIQVSDSSYFTDGADCDEALVGAGALLTNNNAAVDATDGAFTMGEDFTASTDIESELCFLIIAADVANGDTIDIRLYESDGTALGTYTQTPRVTIVKGATITVPAGSFTLSGHVPSIAAGANVDVPEGSLTLSGHVPAVGTGALVTIPAAGSFTLTGHVPAHVGADLVEIEVPAGSFTLTGHVPAVGTGALVTIPAAGSFTLTGHVPAVGTGALVTIPAAGSFTLTGHVPAVVSGGGVEVPAGSFTLTGYIPLVGTGVIVEVPAGSFTLTGYIPLVGTGVIVEVPAGSFTLTGYIPLVAGGGSAIVPAGSFTLTGYIPGISIVDFWTEVGTSGTIETWDIVATDDTDESWSEVGTSANTESWSQVDTDDSEEDWDEVGTSANTETWTEVNTPLNPGG